MKLVVEVVDARDLMPKDGEGSANAFVEVDFGNQRSRTRTVHKDLNPVWNQKLCFNLDDPANLHGEIVDICVYNERKAFPGRNFLGRVRVHGVNIVRQGEEILQRFQLERKWLLSAIKGDLALKLYVCPEPKSPPRPPFSPAIEVKVETRHHINKHQTSSLPAKSVIVKQSPSPVPLVPAMAYRQVHYGQGQPSHSKEYIVERRPHDRSEGWMGLRGGGRDKLTSTYDLVEQMQYLYVRVVKAKDLPNNPITGSCDPYVEVKLGNYRGTTKHFDKRSSPEWNQVFSFSKERIQSTHLEVYVKDREMMARDECVGGVVFDLNEVPTRVPPDSPLAPQWYRLGDRRGDGKVRGEVMLAVWMGTQADEAFPDAWHADAAAVSHGEGVSNIRSKVYVSPKLWYLRVNVIEAQDVVPRDRNRFPELFVKAQVGNQALRTRACPARSVNNNQMWNEDLVFVAAEPFEEHLVLTVEDRVHQGKDDLLARTALPLTLFEKRLDHRPVNSRWFNMERLGFGAAPEESRFSSKIHLRVCLEGAYHVMDESAMYISDTRPTARQLWKQPIGILEVGILGAQGLVPMKAKDDRGTTDAYCIAKYGQKWVRTTTIVDSFSPRWNEQYTWEVYDPCTVITLGVFDNGHLWDWGGPPARDMRIGKVRIRLSTLEMDRIHRHAYPLVVLQPSGLKKMGELQLAVRFTCLSLSSVVYLYGQPLLPKMHYVHPLSVGQVDSLRHQAMSIVAARLGRAEPPLRKETVEYMLDVDSHMWSMRRSKANFFRIVWLLSGAVSAFRWLGDVCRWKSLIATLFVHVLFLILLCFPELILPTAFLYMFLIGLWNYRRRPRQPPEMDAKMSLAEAIHPDELDEEFDTFPTTKPHDLVRLRYDRLRSVAARIQTVVGDMATQGERFRSLLSWRDPRATGLFLAICLAAAVLFYVTPFQVVALLVGLYVLRHPKFRSKQPSVPSNFFKRLPSRIDSML